MNLFVGILALCLSVVLTIDVITRYVRMRLDSNLIESRYIPFPAIALCFGLATIVVDGVSCAAFVSLIVSAIITADFHGGDHVGVLSAGSGDLTDRYNSFFAFLRSLLIAIFVVMEIITTVLLIRATVIFVLQDIILVGS